MRARDGFSFSNVGTGSTAQKYLLGGLYAFTYAGTGTGTATLQVLGPDGATWITAVTAFAATTGFVTVYLPAGYYRVTIATFTANYFSVVRVPFE
jgi:hypothetical protein